MSTSHAARIAATVAALALPLSLLTATSAVAAPTVVTDWVELQTAFAAPSTDTVIALGADITAPEDEFLLMDSDSVLVLDLNSFTLTITLIDVTTRAAVGVPAHATLTIQATGGGTLNATGGRYGAGIGGNGPDPDAGTIIITGGTINALGGNPDNGWGRAAGIGGGSYGDGGTITISGGTVNARSMHDGAGIGGGSQRHGGSITITGGTVEATGGPGGAGIGGGRGGGGGWISITGGTVVSTGGQGGSGIGGGALGNAFTTTISGGTVTATAGRSAAGIGGGSFGGGGTTTITGGTIIAAGGTNDAQSAGGAGIGGGFNSGAGAISITGGSVTATGGAYAAAMGGGSGGLAGTLHIEGTPTPGSATSGGYFYNPKFDGSPITNPTQPPGVGYTATLTVDPFRLDVRFLYRVRFDTLGGTAIPDQNLSLGALATEPSPPTKLGYTFGGWTLVDAPYDFSTPVIQPVTLTASWTAAALFRVTFDTLGGTDIADQDVFDGSAVAQPPQPTRPGYTFDGWTLDGEPYDFSTPVSGPMTLTASWTVTPEPTTERLSGAGRYATAVAISQEAFASGADTVFIATGTGFADALSAAPAAASEGAPLLLTQPTILPTEVKNEIIRLKPSTVVIVGSAGAVSTAVENAIRALSIAPAVRRVSGPDRFATSRAIADAFFDSADNGFIATGLNFPDALAAGPAAAQLGGPVILVPGVRATVDAATLGLLDRLDMTTVYLAGSTRVVSAGIEDQLDALPGVAVQRLSGADRYSTAVAINEAVFDTADRAYISTGLNFADALGGGAAAANQGAPLYITPPRCVAGSVRESITRLSVSTIYILGGPTVLSNEVESLVVC